MIRRLLNRRERGQIVMLSALLAPILLGMSALAVDLGSFSSERRNLQNAADSMALAAAQDLPDATKATTTAQAWAAKNNVAWSNVAFTVTGGNVTPKVTVVINKSHKFSFIQVLGITSSNVGSRAVAGKFSAGATAGVVPWSVTQTTIDASAPGALITIKYDARGGSNGNFGAIRIDGSGASDYENSASYGSTSQLCSVNFAGCAPGVGETAPECDGPQCRPKTGNMTGPTRNAVDFRINNTSAACDTFTEVFPSTVAGRYVINQNCNPWAAGACAPAPSTALCSRRVFLIPVIDGFGNGSSSPVTIQRFALVFLEGYQGGKCSGNSCEIQARFVNADITTGAFAGAYNPTDLVHFVKLTE